VPQTARRLALDAGLVALFSLLLASTGFAQEREERPRRAAFTTAASFGDGETALALSAVLGFAFSDRVGLELEAAYARRQDFTIDLCPPPRVCIIGGRLPVTGRTLALVPQVTLELLPPRHRVRAYVQAGAGAGHVRQRYWFPRQAPDAVEHTRSNLTAAIAYGGGVDVALSRRLAVGADARWLSLFDDEAGVETFITPDGALTTVRIGSRVTWRF
jgi:hypothetical protein